METDEIRRTSEELEKLLKEYEEDALPEYYDLDKVDPSEEDFEPDPDGDAPEQDWDEPGNDWDEPENARNCAEKDAAGPKTADGPGTEAGAYPQNLPASRSREAHKERKKAGQGDGILNLTGGMGLAAAFMIPVLVMVLIFIQRGIFPFGDRSFLRTDMYHQYARQPALQLGCGTGREFLGALRLLSGQPVKLAADSLPESICDRVYDLYDRPENRILGSELCVLSAATLQTA